MSNRCRSDGVCYLGYSWYDMSTFHYFLRYVNNTPQYPTFNGGLMKSGHNELLRSTTSCWCNYFNATLASRFELDIPQLRGIAGREFVTVVTYLCPDLKQTFLVNLWQRYHPTISLPKSVMIMLRHGSAFRNINPFEGNSLITCENPPQSNKERWFFASLLNWISCETNSLVAGDSMTQYNVHLISIQGRTRGHQGRQHQRYIHAQGLLHRDQHHWLPHEPGCLAGTGSLQPR